MFLLVLTYYHSLYTRVLKGTHLVFTKSKQVVGQFIKMAPLGEKNDKLIEYIIFSEFEKKRINCVTLWELNLL